ncbi:MAG: protein-disulfide reductase DsbD domain-containing protein [Pseudomonadota bacterium]
MLKSCALLAALLGLALSGPASAQSAARLLPGWQTENGQRMIGVEILLEPGWKTYWRHPGEGGIPPQFDWTGSANIQQTEVYYPAPSVYYDYGMRAIGYKDRVVFPVALTPQTPGAPVDVALSFFYGVCEEVCIPVQTDFVARLAPGDAEGEEAIRAALDARPRSGADVGIARHRCRIRPDGEVFALTATLTGRVAGAEFAMFDTRSDQIWITTERVEGDAAGLTVHATLEYFGDGAFAFDRSDIRLTLFDAEGAIVLEGCPA